MSYSRIQRLKKELEHAISESNFELALDVVEDMLGVEPDNEKHWNSKGVILAKMDRIEGSIEAFDRSLEIDPKAARSWFSKGVVLMDNGKLRAALGCFYKTLDLEPDFEKARSRFLRCLDDMAALKQTSPAPETGEEKEKWINPPGEIVHETRTPVIGEEEEPDEPEQVRPPPRKRRKGSYLDEDMFSDEEEYEEDEMESWEELDDEEDWGEEDGSEEEIPFITCRCGAKIPIPTEERPFRFHCDDCGRSGTLK